MSSDFADTRVLRKQQKKEISKIKEERAVGAHISYQEFLSTFLMNTYYY